MNWPGFTPCWPSAGPIGGAGVAVPPGAWSLNWTVISFFAMVGSDFAHALSQSLTRGLPAGAITHSTNDYSFNNRRIDSLATLTFERIDDRLRLCARVLTRAGDPLQHPVQRYGQEQKGSETNKKRQDRQGDQ